ncbi:hypothetical protein [Aggregatibacter kilianii]|uniref:hypothetical protein n=1 Tax=Aggregatibacter kilianii TaxID=2025884 RepID=UPI000D64FD50|nr:hypothetical protein [Aggregatibacter kilianii]
MPRRLTQTPVNTHSTMKNVAFESQVVAWLMHDGWQVFTPVLDNWHKTDILISDGEQYFRIQIKTLSAEKGKKTEIENCWGDSKIDYVIYFAREGEWGYILPAFSENKRMLNHAEHRFFELKRKEFLTAFHIV